jgi:hypothetical protein
MKQNETITELVTSMKLIRRDAGMKLSILAWAGS